VRVALQEADRAESPGPKSEQFVGVSANAHLFSEGTRSALTFSGNVYNHMVIEQIGYA